MKKTKTRRHLSITLIEMIIVMILIATITGALAINYQQSLDKGRVFATQQKLERLKAIVTIYFAEHPQVGADDSLNWTDIIRNSGLASAREGDLLQDGWGNPIKIDVVRGATGEASVVKFSSTGIAKLEKMVPDCKTQLELS